MEEEKKEGAIEYKQSINFEKKVNLSVTCLSITVQVMLQNKHVCVCAGARRTKKEEKELLLQHQWKCLRPLLDNGF